MGGGSAPNGWKSDWEGGRWVLLPQKHGAMYVCKVATVTGSTQVGRQTGVHMAVLIEYWVLDMSRITMPFENSSSCRQLEPDGMKQFIFTTSTCY